MSGQNQGKPIKRKRYFINRKFQSRFILKFFGVLLLGAVLSTCITMLTTQKTLTSTYEGSKLIIEKTSLAILPSVIATNVITTGIIGIIVVAITLLVSHKIAGPMYRFERDLEDISRGNLQKYIKIRDGDQFGEFAISLNKMIGGINKKLRGLQKDLEVIEEEAKKENVSNTLVEAIAKSRKSIEQNFKLQ